MHELPQLGRLERTYPNEIAVIGVHSAKYTAEGDTENLRNAVQRFGIEHPVVNDRELEIWDSYAVSAWPTLVFVSPDGLVIGSHAGEVPYESLQRVVAGLIEDYETRDPIDRRPLAPVESLQRPLTQLAYPGKVLATEDALYISDSGHHRVLVASHDGQVDRIFGDGTPGLVDGDLAVARFSRPQGVAFDPRSRSLYVADADNHAVRRIDLDTGLVATVAGTGVQTTTFVRGGAATETPLSSPWDVALHADDILVAMAGLHQIWRVNSEMDIAQVWAGTGHEAMRDGPRSTAWFAQPMGLSLHGGALYAACAETQAVRKIDLVSDEVNTLCGGGLFDFGDEDGTRETALLQHCQGVTAADGTVFVADTYNNKIKVIEESMGTVSTLAGSGVAGLLDGPAPGTRFNGPEGLSIFGDTLYIADTNNHAIRTYNLEDGHVRELALSGL